MFRRADDYIFALTYGSDADWVMKNTAGGGMLIRRIEIDAIARSANGLWMTQIARNLTDAVAGFFTGKRYLIHGRDPLYTKGISRHGCQLRY